MSHLLLAAIIVLSFINVHCDRIQNFGIATSGGTHSGTLANVRLTLLYDSIVYECTITPSALSTEYLCQGSRSIVGDGCGDAQELFIGNTDYTPEIDAVIIDYVFITDSNGNQQTINTNNLCLDRDDCGSNTALIDIDTGTYSKSINHYSYSCDSDSCNSFGINLQETFQDKISNRRDQNGIRGGPFDQIDVTCFRYRISDTFRSDYGIQSFIVDDNDAINRCGLNLREILVRINGLGNANTDWNVRTRGVHKYRGIYIKWSSNNSFKMCLAGTNYQTISSSTIQFTRSSSKPLINMIQCTYNDLVPDYCSGTTNFIESDQDNDDNYESEWIADPDLVLESELTEEDNIFAQEIEISTTNGDNTMISIICVIAVLMIGVVIYGINKWNKHKEYDEIQSFEEV